MHCPRLVWSVAAVIVAGAGQLVSAQGYALIHLGGSTSAMAINERGWITGARGESAYLWRNGTFETRPRAGGGCCSYGYDINDLGDILIQAVQQNGCKISQLVVHQFE